MSAHEQEKYVEGDRFLAEMTSNPEDFFAIIEEPERVDLELWRSVEEELANKHGARLKVIEEPFPWLNADDSVTFTRVYRVEEIRGGLEFSPGSVYSDIGTELVPNSVPALGILTAALVALAIVAAWDATRMTTNLGHAALEPIDVFVQKIREVDFDRAADAAGDAADAIKTVAVGLVVGILLLKLA